LALVLKHLKKSYSSVWISFSHFAFNSVGDEFVITEKLLLLALNRNAAIIPQQNIEDSVRSFHTLLNADEAKKCVWASWG